MRLPAGRLAPAFLIAALFVVASTVTRALLALRADLAFTGALGELLRIFACGFSFDVVMATCVTLPIALWLALLPDVAARSRLHRALTVLVFAAFAYVAILLAIAEWLFWEEFGARFNFIAVDYLLYTHEVLGNIWESYPVSWLLGALALAAAALTALAARRLSRWSAAPLGRARGRAVVAVQVALVAAITGFVDG